MRSSTNHMCITMCNFWKHFLNRKGVHIYLTACIDWWKSSHVHCAVIWKIKDVTHCRCIKNRFALNCWQVNHNRIKSWGQWSHTFSICFSWSSILHTVQPSVAKVFSLSCCVKVADVIVMITLSLPLNNFWLPEFWVAQWRLITIVSDVIVAAHRNDV